ncbi:hypothetical protein CLOP_g5187, partial [Closterium sp. NIES-67]
HSSVRARTAVPKGDVAEGRVVGVAEVGAGMVVQTRGPGLEPQSSNRSSSSSGSSSNSHLSSSLNSNSRSSSSSR